MISTTRFMDEVDMDVQCDEVGCESTATLEGTWNQCIQQLKEEGWRTFRVEDNQWRHHCKEHYKCEYCKLDRKVCTCKDEIY